VSHDFDLFVIGGGSAGVRCARISAGHGARVGVAEDRFWGGTCVNIGCVPKKLMVMASEYGGALRDARGFGWNVADGAHDWATLIANKDAEIGRLNAIYRRLLGNAGATIFDARASFIDAHTLDVGGTRITAERIVIATGGHPTRPAFPGGEHCIVSDDAFYLPQRPQRVVMLGGGYIAVEFAGIFAGLGSDVQMVMRQPLPLRGFDHDLREGLAEALEAQGIRLHRSVAPSFVEDIDGVRRVHLTNGEVLTADLVFAAIGRSPNVTGLGLDRAGVAVGKTGAVVVDETGATSQPHIYAIGDVTDRLNLTPVATAEGHALADALYGPGPRAWASDRVATAVFSTPPLATVGMTEHDAARRGSADIYLTRFTPMRHALSGRGRKSMMKLIVDRTTDQILGAHMLGEDAPEIMQGLSIAINCGATKADFDRTVGIHPTAAEEFVTLRTRTRECEAPPVGDALPLVSAEEIGPAEMGVGD
jgi:glutathione reductase (NADPH)